MAYVFWFLIVPIGAFLFFFLKSYNLLQRSSQLVKEGASNIKVMLRKKLELTKQLMDVCKGYAEHEQFVNLRVSADIADSFKDLGYANARAEQAMSFMGQLANRFPNLKADHQFLLLSRQLTDLGSELQAKREGFNRCVRDYNAERSAIPTVFVARALAFPEASFLNFDDDGSMDILQTFQTDDGARLEALISSVGSKIGGTGAAFAKRAKEATFAAVEIGREKLGTMKYRYSVAGKPSGPVSRRELDRLAQAGLISHYTFIIEDGGTQWITFGDLVTRDMPPVASLASVPPPPDA